MICELFSKPSVNWVVKRSICALKYADLSIVTKKLIIVFLGIKI